LELFDLDKYLMILKILFMGLPLQGTHLGGAGR